VRAISSAARQVSRSANTAIVVYVGMTCGLKINIGV
jgi:hypothetical protein